MLEDLPNLTEGRNLIVKSLKSQLKHALPAVLVGLIWTVMMVVGPLAIESGVDRGVLKENFKETLLWAGAIVLIGLLQGGASAIRRYKAFSMAYGVETDLRRRLFDHLVRLHMGFHDSAQTGALMSRSVSDLQQVSNFAVNIPITLSSVVILVASMIAMFLISPLLAIIVISFIPIFGGLTKIFSSKSNQKSLDFQKSLASMSSLAQESISGMRAIKGLGAEPAILQEAKLRINDIYRQAISVARLRALYSPIQTVLSSVVLALIVFVGGYQVIKHELPLGAVIAFIAYVNMLAVPLGLISFTVSMYPRAKASAARVAQILNLSPVITDPAKPKEISVKKGDTTVEFCNVTFSYPFLQHPILENFSLTASSNEVIALVGPTGSGKTTIVKLLLRFYDVQQGSIKINGVDIRDLSLKHLRSQIGIVFEDTFLFTDTIYSNIAFANPDKDFQAVKNAAKLAGIDDFIMSLPNGYNTIVKERGINLSGGQRQRIAIARAIINDPAILVLDDATSAVDTEKEQEILSAIKQVITNRLAIIIARRLSTLALATRVVVIEKGKVVASDSHDELLKGFPRYKELIGIT
jgi:ATP-binding cassette subfamily B protein